LIFGVEFVFRMTAICPDVMGPNGTSVRQYPSADMER